MQSLCFLILPSAYTIGWLPSMAPWMTCLSIEIYLTISEIKPLGYISWEISASLPTWYWIYLRTPSTFYGGAAFIETLLKSATFRWHCHPPDCVHRNNIFVSLALTINLLLGCVHRNIIFSLALTTPGLRSSKHLPCFLDIVDQPLVGLRSSKHYSSTFLWHWQPLDCVHRNTINVSLALTINFR